MSSKAKTLMISAFAIVLLISFVNPGHSQTETGQITGTVYDPSGAVIPNAKVTVKSTTTGLERTTKSTSSGTYAITSLLPGPYTVTAEASGFSPVSQTTTITVGAAVGLDLHMQVGGFVAALEVVEAPAALINTETQTISQTVTGQEILLLPTLTRNPYDLVQSVGNVSEADPGGRGVGVAINGLRASSTGVTLDGVTNSKDFDTTVGIKVPLDSVQEFSVVTGDFTAEYGRAAGGVVNVATRSGSNAFHGGAYEFNRISALASNTFDNNANGTPKPVFTRNQFGYSAGGPVVHDKLFFFENTEWTKVRSLQNQTAVIATPQLIAASAPNTQQFFHSFGTLKPNLVNLQTFTRGAVCTSGDCTAIPADTPIYQKVSYAVPSDSGGGNPQDTYALVGRADYNLRSRDQMFFRYALYKADFALGTQTNSPYVGFDSADFQTNQGFVYSETHTYSSNLTGQTKLSFSRIQDVQPLGAKPVGPTLYTTLSSTSSLGNAQIVYPGYSPYTPGNSIPFGGPQNIGSINEDVSWIHNRHTVRFGGLYEYIRDNRAFGAYEEAVEALGTDRNSAVNGLVDGQLHDFQVAFYPQGKFPCIAGVVTPDCTLTLPVTPPDFTRSNRYHQAALYVQDSWKTTAHLTLNLGLRWEYFGPPADKDPNKDANFYLGSGANLMQQVGNGKVYLAPKSPVGGTWAKDWSDYGPRVGFAWGVNDKTSVRGGYGIGYERNFNNVTFNMIQNVPLYGNLAFTAGVDAPTIPVTTDNAGPLSGTGTKPIPAVSLRAVDPHIKTAYAHQWSGAVEHELSNDLLVGLEYSGSRGVNLYTIDRVNAAGSNAIYGPGPVPTTSRINPQYSAFNFRTSAGNSIYHGLNAKIQMQNFRKYGVTLRANYTYSHSIDTSSSTFGNDNAGYLLLGPLDPLNPGLDRGSSDFDVRHRFALSGVWAEQFFKAKGPMNWIGGGWNVAPILNMHTGTPFTIFDSTHSGDAFLNPRVMFGTKFNPVYTDTSTGNPNEFAYLDLSSGKPDSSYVNPIVGNSSYGPFPANMSGRNTFGAPGFWRFSMGVYKDFTVTEKVKLQFRAESYNIFNHSNLYIVYNNLAIGSSGAPIITADRGLRNDSTFITSSTENGRIENRNMQFALRVIF